MADQPIQIRFTVEDLLSPTLRTMQAGLAQLAAQSQQTTQVLARLGVTSQQIAQGQTASARSTQQLGASYIALAQATRDQTAAYAHAQAAALAYKKQQDVLRESLRQQREAQRQANEEAQRSGTLLQQVFAVAGGIGLATSIGAVIGQLKAFGVSVIDVGAKLELLRVSLAAVAGSQRAGQQAFTESSALANRLGLSTVSLTESYRSLIAATRGTGLEGAQTARLFENVTLASRTLGSSNEQTGRAFVALQQIISKGTLSMEELRGQMSEAIPGAMQIAARSMGVTTAELTKLIEKGNVDGVQFAKNFGEQLRKELGGGAEAAAQTASAAFTRLENEWNALKGRIAESGPLRFLATVASGVAGALNETTVRDEAVRTGMIERAAAAAGRTPRDTVVPGILESATLAERVALLKAEEALFALEERRERLRKTPSDAWKFESAQQARDRELKSLREIEAIYANIEIRRQVAGKAQAIAEPDTEPGAELFVKGREAEQKATARLDALATELRTLQRRTDLAMQGQTASRALELTTAARAERDKLTEKALEEAQALLAQRPEGFGGTSQVLQERIAALGRGVGQVTDAKEAEAQLQRLGAAGRADIARIALDPTFLTELEKANAQLKVAEETTKAIREEMSKLSEPLRQQLGSVPATIVPASMLRPVAPRGTSSGEGNLTAVARWRPLIAQLTAGTDVPPALVEAIMAQESGGNSEATGRDRETGLMQILPSTGTRIPGFAGHEYEPEANIKAGIFLLAQLFRQFSGNLTQVIAAYNAGPGKGGIPQPGGNQDYVTRVSGNLALLQGRIPTGVSPGPGGVLDQATAQEAALRAAVEGQKPDTERQQRTMEIGKEVHASMERAVTTLEKLKAAYTQTREARDEDTASLIKAQFPTNQAIQEEADLVISKIATRAAYQEEVAALRTRFVALKQAADAQRESEDAQDAYNKTLKDTLLLLNTPRDERASAALRTQAPGGVTTVAQEGALAQVDLKSKAVKEAEAQARQMTALYRDVGRSIEDSLTGAFFAAFESGGVSSRAFGLSLLRGLQQTFAQLSRQLVTSLLNAATGSTEQSGGWVAALAGIVVKAAGAYLGGGGATGVDVGAGASTGPGADFSQSGATLFDTNTSFNATGGVIPAMSWIKPLRMASGGVVRQPSFALIGENPGHHEAVVPLSNNRSIPVEMRGQQQAPQQMPPIHIHLEQSYEGALDPRSIRTSKSEVTKWVIDNINADGPLRTVIKANTR